MIGPLQNNGAIGAVNSVEASLRSDLSSPSSHSSVEIPTRAVGHVVEIKETNREIPPYLHDYAVQIERLKAHYNALEKEAAKAKELAALRDKLVKNIDPTSVTKADHKIIGEASKAVEAVMKDKGPLPLPNQHKDVLPQPKTAQPALDRSINDPKSAGTDDQQAVLLRINEALDAVNEIMAKIFQDSESSSNKILNLSGSIASLNSARSTVDKTQLSLSVANNTVDLIMTNIKTALVSHGNVSADLVRLVI